MRRNRVFDRYGRVVASDVCPPGGRVVVDPMFMDALSERAARAFGDAGEPQVLHRPGFAQAALSDDFARTNSHERSQSASEAAREDYVRRISNAWQVMPRTATKPRPGLAQYGDAAEDGDPSEAAYERMKRRLSDAWRNTDDNAAEGVSTSDLPPDIAALPLDQQEIYCSAYNQHMEQFPSATDQECDQAGRAALHAGDSIEDAEARRASAHAAYVRRISEAWRS